MAMIIKYKSFNFLLFSQEDEEGVYYIGGLRPYNDSITHGEDLERFLRSELRKIKVSENPSQF